LGIIQKQATRSTIISFAGAFFGSISRLIMPFFLETSQIGILTLLDAKSGVFVIALNFGYVLILKKLFPKYRNEENGHAGFLALGIFLSLIGSLIGFAFFYLFEEIVFTDLAVNDPIRPFLFLIPILIFFKIIFSNLDGYVRMLFKTVVGTFLNGFASKIVLLLGLCLFVYSLIDFEFLVYFYVFSLSLPGLVTFFYAFFITKKIKLPSVELLGESKKIRFYILFGLLSGASYSIIQYVDMLMIDGIIKSKAEVGVYSTMFFASILIAIPARGVYRISSVIVAESWKDNDLKNIQKVYSKSALSLLIIGGYIFIVGWFCIGPVLEFLPEYQHGKYAFFFLGLAKVIELGTGVNSEIIDTSEKYKFNTYFNVLLAVLAIVFNYILISAYGIIGAAIASFLAMTIINFLRGAFLYKMYRLLPFSSAYIKSIAIITAFITFGIFLDYEANPIVKITINVTTVSLLFWFLVIKLKLSQDINDWILKIKTKFIK